MTHEIRFAIQAFRNVRPSRALEERVFGALDDPEKTAERPRSEDRQRTRQSRLTLAFAVVGGVAALIAGVFFSGALMDFVGPDHHRSEELAIQLPEEGHTWVDLPLSTHWHPEGKATVYMDAPASVALHLPEEGSSSSRQTNCGELRCMHQWSAAQSADDDVTGPRVQIKDPGRYEFTVMHTSSELRYKEKFLIHAKR